MYIDQCWFQVQKKANNKIIPEKLKDQKKINKKIVKI